MSQEFDILIVVDCAQALTDGALTKSAVSMYAADHSIIRESQGTYELWVQVPTESVLRWRAVPLQIADAENQRYQVVITQVKLWGTSPSDRDQLDAYPYLGPWSANPGTSFGTGYNGPQSFMLSDPAPGAGSTSNPANVSRIQLTDPFVQTTCNGVMDSSNYVAYSFICTVYKNGILYTTVSWDPYVTVVAG